MTSSATVPVITAFNWVPDFAKGKVRDLRVRWAFEELGESYDTKLFNAGTPRPDEYLAWQPFDQVPAFADGECRFFETGAILLYLAEKYGKLLPESPPQKWRAISWLFASLNSVEVFLAPIPVYDLFEANSSWVADARPSAVERAERKLQRVSDALGAKEWLAGEFSIADIGMACVFAIIDHTDILAGYPNLVAYKARAEARPAFRRALEAQLADFTAEQPKQMQGA